MTESGRTPENKKVILGAVQVTMTRGIVAATVLVAALYAVLLWSPWESPSGKGRSLASVPEHMCNGLLAADDVAPLDFLRQGATVTSESSPLFPGEFSCRVGDESKRLPNLFVDIGPMSLARTQWTVTDFEWRSPLGAGLIGMMQEDSAWLYVPCPGGRKGDLVARAAVRHGNLDVDPLWSADLNDEERALFARLLVHAANVAAERSGCQTNPLSDAVPPITPQYSGIRVCSDALESPVPPNTATAPLEACSTPNPASIESITYRGPFAGLVPELGTIWNDRLLVTKSIGVCGGEEVVWTGWVKTLGGDTGAAIAAHKNHVNDDTQRNNCQIREQSDVPT